MRDLLFVIWLKAGKDISKTIELVESLVVAQFETVSEGGARMVQATVAGKTFQYELPDNWSVTDFMSTLRLCYKQLMTGGASGGQMTEDELQSFVLDSNNQVTNVAKARFAHNPGSRY